jgi:hypothetical protein
MNAKNFLTAALVVNLVYGLWYFIDPAGTHGVYGMAADATPLSIALVQYLGAACISIAVMCGFARNAGPSAARTGVMALIAASGLLWLYLNIRGMGATPTTMAWVDMAVNALLGLGALYFIVQDRKSSAAVAGIA